MFAFIDESGNTGSDLSNPEHPYFYHMALFSSKNLDLDLDGTVRRILTEYNIRELHAHQQSNLIENYAEEN